MRWGCRALLVLSAAHHQPAGHGGDDLSWRHLAGELLRHFAWWVIFNLGAMPLSFFFLLEIVSDQYVYLVYLNRKSSLQFRSNDYCQPGYRVSFSAFKLLLFKQSLRFFFSPSSDKLMWLHTTVAFLYLLLTVLIMRKHNSRMHYKKDDLVWGRDFFSHAHTACAQSLNLCLGHWLPLNFQVKCTLFVNGMSKNADESEIKQHFE